jgi:quinol monooxygenase YgiN
MRVLSRPDGASAELPHHIGETEMIVVRFKVQCQPDKTTALKDAFTAVIAPARATNGVITFDIAQDVTDPDTFIATEVFADQTARERQEALPEVAAVMALLPTSLAAPPEVAEYTVSEPALA